MIGRLEGKVLERDGRVIILDVGGVGYEVNCSQRVLERVETGETLRVVIYTDVREDQIALYGFSDRLEKQVFLLLTQVKGVGSKSASEILSWINPSELLRSIGSGDANRIQQIKGIGKKSAERIIVELKDKVVGLADERRGVHMQVEVAASEPQDEAVEALLALGFSEREARGAVSEAIRSGVQSEAGEIVKSALQFV